MFLQKEASFKEAYISRISLKVKICTLSIGYQTLFQSDLLLLLPRLTGSSWTCSSSRDTEPSLSDKQSCCLWACAVEVCSISRHSVFWFADMRLKTLSTDHSGDLKEGDHPPPHNIPSEAPEAIGRHILWRSRELCCDASQSPRELHRYGSVSHGLAASAGMLPPCGYFE